MFISCFKMNLAFLGIVSALNFDNELRVIKIDCYERLAIGEKLDPNKVYKSFPYNTVGDCKKACSEEKSVCKAFSFGIAAKGNATCELSVEAIKETADLKPIGTVKDTDYDLYIKKMGCTLVTDSPHRKPPTQSVHLSTKPATLGNIPDEITHHDLPIEPGSSPPATSSIPGHQDGIHNVQTLVSVATGPQTVFDPNHGILVAGENQNGYDTGADSLSYWYNNYEQHNNVQHELSYNSFSNYNGITQDLRPFGPLNYPDVDRHDVRPDDKRIYNDRYGEQMPPRRYFHSDHSYNRHPLPDRYGSVIPHPDHYYKRPTHQDYPYPHYKPNNLYDSNMGYHYNRPIKPYLEKPDHDYYDKPSKPVHGSGDDYNYNKPSRPFIERPVHESSDDYNYNKPLRPFIERPVHESSDDYNYNKPLRPFIERPVHESSDEYGYNKPSRPSIERPDHESSDDYNNKPSRPFIKRPVHESGDDYHYSKPPRPFIEQPVHGYHHNEPSRPVHDSGDSYQYNKPSKPFLERPVTDNNDINSSRPVSLSLIYEIGKPGGNGQQTNMIYQEPPKKLNNRPSNDVKYPGQDYGSKPIVTYSTGHKGEQITSIITEIKDKACFRRVLAGKRISRGLVRRALACESVEDCQSECADEKIFICEGFNYRIDPSGRGKGDCELLSVPLSRIDVYRESYPDPDYDYYERDRNAAALNCRPQSQKYSPYSNGYNDYDDYRHGHPGSSLFPGGNRWADRRFDYEAPRRPPPRPESWPIDYFRPSRPDIDRRYDYQSYDYGTDRRPVSNRRGDFSYLPQTTHYYDRIDNRRYSAAPPPPPPLLPPKPRPYDQKPYDSFTFPQYHKYQKNDYQWGLDHRRYGERQSNSYLPPKKDAPSDWGLYHKYQNNYSHWGLSKYGGGAYLPPDPGLRPPPDVGSYPLGPKPFEGGGILDVPDSSLLPVEHRRPTYNYNQEECSLRSVTGFKLHKRIVKKYFAVPNIYECELLCFKEIDFLCSSYAYRYTITASEPTDNCYLSNVDYKELDNYTDLEPDRDFDIYTMNNKNRCAQPVAQRSENSDCFWRVRSGERLHDKIVRDSLKAHNIVECQVECLKSRKFTCRAFSYRYGPYISGGLIDNCQLTDWPYHELDTRIHFIVEPGFEIYERGSFGHGCETGHFGIRGYPEPKPTFNPDQLCYIGFGAPARLLSQAIKKSVRVSSDIDCKNECSKARIETLFQCMSFSFKTNTPATSPNCYLSDIYQRDLLPKLDYLYDPDSLLFAWDNYNPDCVILGDDPLRTNHITNGLYERDYFTNALDTWTVYSVRGWPCKRGAKCKENVEAGFWFCELEGGTHGAWDYCCRPEHQCGASNGYPYLWCYVGPDKTQWRKCSDRYYPYQSTIDRHDDKKYFSPNSYRRPWRQPVFRPDRIPAEPHIPPPSLSLDEYEKIFNDEFLEPPLPGGLGQPRHWPVSYLHKEMPPNATESKLARMEADNSKQSRKETDNFNLALKETVNFKLARKETDNSKLARMETDNSKYAAIQNLINVIKNNDLNNIQYHISNESNKNNDILFVKIPIPTNFTKEKNLSSSSKSINLEPVTVDEETSLESKRLQKSLTEFVDWNTRETTIAPERAISVSVRPSPVYRRAFITRTNVTTHGRHL